MKTLLLLTVDDSTFHPEALEKGCGETASQEVRAHPKMPTVEQAEEPL